jgi:fructosamine-3-kinase
MPLANDVSWPLLRGIVRDWLGGSAELEGVKTLHGGSMSTTLLLSLKGRESAVLKIAPHMVVPQYEQEAYQLNLLRDWGLPTPEVYACQVGRLDAPHSYLLMERMPGIMLSEAGKRLDEDDLNHIQMHLAEIVLSLHGRSSGTYKRVCAGGEEGIRDYVEFFRSIYDPIWNDVVDMKQLPPPLRRRVGAIHDKLEQVLHHDDKPRLIHGDLWSSNLLVAPDRQRRWWVSAILDPNCRYSHAEIELAYLELFRTVTPTFFRVYEQSHRLPEEYRRFRRDLYSIYPLLNHIRLFGPQYIKPLAIVAERVAKAIAARRGYGKKRTAKPAISAA